MPDQLLEHIGDLPSIIESNQKDTDYYEVESTNDTGNPVSVKETANLHKRRMIAAGPIKDYIDTRVTNEAGRAQTAESNNASAATQAMTTAQTAQAMAGQEQTRATAAEAVLLTAVNDETTRAETEEAKKLDKHATHANGSTDITNSPENDGFSAVTTQTDTQTDFRFETNSEAGNPVLGGLVGRTVASASAGSRRLLFVHTSGGIRIHIRKDKDIPAVEADLSDDDLVLNKGEIDSLVNDIMAALSQGLKTPGVIDKESNLPTAAGEPNGTYYVIQDLDVTSPGNQGRAWKNDAMSTTDWQVVVDNVFAPDGTTIDLNAGGSLEIAALYQEKINGAVQGSTKGIANGVATLDGTAKVPVAQLPIDGTPTEASTNPVSSGGVNTVLTAQQAALEAAQAALEADQAAITAETTARQNADGELQEQINSLDPSLRSFPGAGSTAGIVRLYPGFVGKLTVVTNFAATDLVLYQDVYVSKKTGNLTQALSIKAVSHKSTVNAQLSYEEDAEGYINIFFVRLSGAAATYGGNYRIEVMSGNYEPIAVDYPYSALVAIPTVSDGV